MLKNQNCKRWQRATYLLAENATEDLGIVSSPFGVLRSNFASNSKPQSQSHAHIPILNLKRKRDYGFLPDLLSNAKPHLDVGFNLDENPKPHKIKLLKIIAPKKPPHSCSATLMIHDMEGHTNTVAPVWFSFNALVEVAFIEIEKFDEFARLIQEKALKKPIFIQDKVKSKHGKSGQNFLTRPDPKIPNLNLIFFFSFFFFFCESTWPKAEPFFKTFFGKKKKTILFKLFVVNFKETIETFT